jgi:hypothetical protein
MQAAGDIAPAKNSCSHPDIRTLYRDVLHLTNSYTLCNTAAALSEKCCVSGVGAAGNSAL